MKNQRVKNKETGTSYGTIPAPSLFDLSVKINIGKRIYQHLFPPGHKLSSVLVHVCHSLKAQLQKIITKKILQHKKGKGKKYKKEDTKHHVTELPPFNVQLEQKKRGGVCVLWRNSIS